MAKVKSKQAKILSSAHRKAISKGLEAYWSGQTKKKSLKKA